MIVVLGCFWCCFCLVGFLGVCDLRAGGRGIHWWREFVVGCDGWEFWSVEYSRFVCLDVWRLVCLG